MRRRVVLLALLTLSWLNASAQPADGGESAARCGQPGQWLAPATGDPKPLAAPLVLERLAAQQVVLLGEIHERADDHRWQLDVLTALHGRHADLAVGFEMFPRRVQRVLDRWVAGELTEAEFLQQVEWDRVWGYDARHYLPLFRFARQHRLPMLALNVGRELVRQVGDNGWRAVPEAGREGIGDAAPPSAGYRHELKTVFDQHAPAREPRRRFDHFVEAQLVWDRAMAEVIAGHLQSFPQRRVVVILGQGHIRNGFGVPHQLSDLGVSRQISLMTWPGDHSCAALTAGLADAVFVIPPQPQTGGPPPRMGVRLDTAADGVLIEAVVPGSLAARAGLKSGDVVTQAGGRKPAGIEDFRDTVRRQPAGAELPLQIRRGSEVLEMVVLFPAAP
jgi:uncharacterized iron-regulated protein